MLHEELSSPTDGKQPFLELLPSPSPFYTGWDANNHKMVLTSRTLPRIGALLQSSFNGRSLYCLAL